MRKFILMVLILGLISSVSFAKEKDGFRFKLLYQSRVISGLDFNAQDYNKCESKQFTYYFGNWWWLEHYAWGGLLSDYGWLGTFTEVDYRAGDILPLYQMRQVNKEKIGQNFGIELEARILKNTWVGASFILNPKFIIDTLEEKEEMVFEEFRQIDECGVWGNEDLRYYEYEMKLDRFFTTQETSEKFSSINFQFYAKQEFGSVFGGIGLDIWQLKREFKKNLLIHELSPWTDARIILDKKEVNRSDVDINWYFRPFLLAGINILSGKGLYLGLQGKIFLLAKEFHYKRDFLFPIPDNSDYWTRWLEQGSLALVFGF